MVSFESRVCAADAVNDHGSSFACGENACGGVPWLVRPDHNGVDPSLCDQGKVKCCGSNMRTRLTAPASRVVNFVVAALCDTGWSRIGL